MISPWP